MGWLWLVGSIQLKVCFAKKPYKRDDILKKRPIILSILLTVANPYGVATVSRIEKIIGLFCRISSLLQGSFAKETYDFIDPTNRSHPIAAEVNA